MKKIWQIFSTMFVIGLFTFGGGLSMIPQMTRIFADKHGWVTADEIVDYYAVSQSLPGAIAINTSVMIGYRLAGIAGALTAALGSVLPSLLVLIVVTIFYQAFIENPVMLGAMRGIRAAVTALLFYAVWGGRNLLFHPAQGAPEDNPRPRISVSKSILCLAAAVLVLLDVNPVWVILGGAVLGGLFWRIGNKK